MCVGGSTNCSGSCVNLASDISNCGSCGNGCATGATCSSGTCQCPGALGIACGGKCVDGATDRKNCGSCGNVCGSTCSAGACRQIVQLTSGEQHSCALASDGTIWCWGWNTNWQLGDGTNLNRFAPVKVSGITNAVAVSAGPAHTCAILADGTVRCWGYGGEGGLGNGATTSSSVPVQVVVSGGGALTGATQISTGRHSCVRKTDGTAWCWGANWNGQLSDGTTNNRSVATQVLASAGVPLTAVSEVGAAGNYTSCFRLVDGTVRCAGWGGNGALGDGGSASRSYASAPVVVSGGTPLVGVTALGSANVSYNGTRCARLTDGTAWCWGYGGASALGDGSTSSRPYAAPVLVAPSTPLSGVASIGVGYHGCARLVDGGVRCWGENGQGQVGDGTTTHRPYAVPVTVEGGGALGDVLEIAAGYLHTCARQSDHTIQCWGYNGSGQLGAGGSGGPSSVAAPVIW